MINNLERVHPVNHHSASSAVVHHTPVAETEKTSPLINAQTQHSTQQKTLRNRAIAGAALGAVILANPAHHVEHALIHGILGPIVSSSILDPVTKLVTGNAQISHAHGHGGHSHDTHEHSDASDKKDTLSNKAMNFATEVYHGMMHHLATQIVFDQMLRLWRGGKVSTGHHH